jgi:hypothetical protein
MTHPRMYGAAMPATIETSTATVWPVLPSEGDAAYGAVDLASQMRRASSSGVLTRRGRGFAWPGTFRNRHDSEA